MDALVSPRAAANASVSLGRDLAVVLLAGAGQQAGRAVAGAAALAAETAVTIRAVRTVLVTLAEALEAGLLDDLRGATEDLGRAVTVLERVADQLERAAPATGVRPVRRPARPDQPELELAGTEPLF